MTNQEVMSSKYIYERVQLFLKIQVPPDRHLSLYAYSARSPLRPDTRQAAPYQSRPTGSPLDGADAIPKHMMPLCQPIHHPRPIYRNDLQPYQLYPIESTIFDSILFLDAYTEMPILGALRPFLFCECPCFIETPRRIIERVG